MTNSTSPMNTQFLSQQDEIAYRMDTVGAYTFPVSGVPTVQRGPRPGTTDLEFPNGALRRVASPELREARTALLRVRARNAARRSMMSNVTDEQRANMATAESKAQRVVDQVVRDTLDSWGITFDPNGHYVVIDDFWAEGTAAA